MKTNMKKFLSILLAGGMILSLGGCGNDEPTTEPSSREPVVSAASSSEDDSKVNSDSETDTDIVGTLDKPTAVNLSEKDEEKINYGINRFNAELFKREFEKREDKSDNVFLSPLSVYTALSVLDNGAAGETRSELNALLGGIYPDGKSSGNPVELDKLNSYFGNYIKGLGGENTKFNMANSVWVMKRDDVKLNDVFGNNISEFYSAEIFNEDADKAVGSINSWVSDKTDKMIRQILTDGDISNDTVEVLLNAVAFDGKWKKEYEKDDVREDTFNNYDGSKSKVDFMYSTEDYYFSDDNAKGFIKDYQSDGDKQYSFVGVLPNEDIGIDEYVKKYFDDSTINDYVENSISADVETSLPKFSFDTKYTLNGTLEDMGMNKSFSPSEADFTNIAEANNKIYVSKVFHKAHIEVDEKGTKAAAVTAIIMEDNCIMTDENEVYEVYLDRPFLFAIYDRQEKMPLFIGTVCSL